MSESSHSHTAGKFGMRTQVICLHTLSLSLTNAYTASHQNNKLRTNWLAHFSLTITKIRLLDF